MAEDTYLIDPNPPSRMYEVIGTADESEDFLASETLGNSERITKMEKSRDAKEEVEVPQEMSCYGFLKSLKIEPFFVLFTFAFAMRMTADSDLIFNRLCHQDFNEVIENCRNDTLDLKEKVQKSANNYKVYIDLIEFSPSILVSTILGPWCDKYGRKFPCTVGIVGMMLHVTGLLIISIYKDLPIYYLFFSAIPAGLSGGLITVMGNVYSLASEQSSKHGRTFKYALLELGKTMGFPLGMVSAGQLVKYSYVYIYSTSLVAFILSILWLNLMVKEKIRHPGVAISKKIKDLFDLSNFKESLHTCFKKRDNYGREQILLLTLSICIGVLVLIGSKTMDYFYTMKMYGWDLSRFSEVSSIFNFSGIVTSLLFTYFFTKRWPIREPIIGLLGSGSTIFGTAVLAFASMEWIYFIGQSINLLGSIASLGVRSLVSKLVEPHELGKVFAFIATCESLVPVAGVVLFTRIYNASVDFFPGLFLLVCTGLTLIPLAVFTWTFKLDLLQSRAMMNTSSSTEVLDMELGDKTSHI